MTKNTLNKEEIAKTDNDLQKIHLVLSSRIQYQATTLQRRKNQF